MNAKQREALITSFWQEQVLSVMATKGEEYSRGEEDVNSNFKRVAEGMGLDPIQVAYVYMAKHWDSITSYVKTRQTPSGEPIEGRLGDLINYALIMASLIAEQQAEMDEQVAPAVDQLMEGWLRDHAGQPRSQPEPC